MSTDRDVTGIVRSWLEDGATSLPERVLDDVLAQVPTTPQRRPSWPAWRFHSMSSPFRIALVAAAIGALALVSIDVLPRSPDIGAAPAPSSSPSPSPALLEGYGPSLAAGTYRQPLGTGTWTVTVPEGWEEFYGILWADVDGVSTPPTAGGPGEVALGWWTVANVFTDPCHWQDSLADPPVGPSVDDLAAAFVAQVGRDGSGPTDVVLGGYPATRVELSVPADLDVATCDEGVYREFLDVGESLTLPEGVDAAKPIVGGRTDVLYILEIDGTRFVLISWHDPDASAQDVAEMEAMLASIVIEPLAPSPAPSGSPGALAWSPASLEQDWPAPVRTEPVGDPVIMPVAGGYTDPAGDIESSDTPWIDIQSVTAGNVRAGSRKGLVLVEVVALPPSPSGDSNEPWIAYGLVFDTDLDGVADIRLGMDRVRAEFTPWDSSGPCPASSGSSGSLAASGGEPSPSSRESVCGGTGGDRVRAWRTDLRTGTTEHGEAEFTVCDCLFPSQLAGRIYPHQAIPGRFYAWASVILDGRVVATDHAPDVGWLE
jgi:hypothetical protein